LFYWKIVEYTLYVFWSQERIQRVMDIVGRVLISGWNWIGLSCLPKAFIYLASNTADGLSAFFRVFLYLQICFHNFSVNYMYLILSSSNFQHLFLFSLERMIFGHL
jgi:hypothetical protein